MGSKSKQHEKDTRKKIQKQTKKSHVGRGKSESEEEKGDKGGKKSISKTGKKSRHGAGLTEKKKNATLQFGMLVFK